MEENSTEIYPPITGCTSTPLPEERRMHATFIRFGSNPKVAACGGRVGTPGYSYSTSCIVLDVENQRWDENVIGDLTRTFAGNRPKINLMVLLICAISLFTSIL